MEKSITLQIENRVGYILINRPKANCYEINFHKQLIACIQEANSNEEVKVIVIKSALEKFFSAGADVKVFEANSIDENNKMVEHARIAADLLDNSEKITIAAIAGHALGGGLELALACDFRLAAKGNYYLGLPESKLGLMPGNGGSQRLIRLIDKSKAMELLITGDYIGPKEAHTIGLVNHLYEADIFNEQVSAYAEKIAQGPLQAIIAIKKAVKLGSEMSLKDGLALEDSLVNPLYDTDDAREGQLAFVEKRTPKFK